jgi:integrase
MRRVDPHFWKGKTVVDLRGFGFGQRYPVGPADMSREDAIHAGYALVSRLQRDAMAELPARDLFAERAPQKFATVLDSWQAQKRYDRPGSAKWGREYAGLVRRELGHYDLADFAPPAGNARLVAYVAELGKAGLSGRTMRNRLSITEQVLRFAVERGWLAIKPLHPRMPPKAAPVFHWVSEAMFRAFRAELFAGKARTRMRCVPELRQAAEAEIALYVERRRLYCSWLFYTGVHAADADTASADQLFLDGRAYIRHNHKSSRSVPDEQFEMPEPLYRDLKAFCDFVDRPFFPGELFAGGKWHQGSRAMQAAATRLGFPHGCNPSILRRSYAREMFLRGYTVREVADRMGHVDERMLKEIYVRTPRATGHAKSRWQIPAPETAPRGPGGMARVLSLRENAKGGA